jgi:hypothetical protein
MAVKEGALSASAAPAIASSDRGFETDSASVMVFVQRSGNNFGYVGLQAPSQLDCWIMLRVRSPHTLISARRLGLHRSISWCFLEQRKGKRSTGHRLIGAYAPGSVQHELYIGNCCIYASMVNQMDQVYSPCTPEQIWVELSCIVHTLVLLYVIYFHCILNVFTK